MMKVELELFLSGVGKSSGKISTDLQTDIVATTGHFLSHIKSEPHYTMLPSNKRQKISVSQDSPRRLSYDEKELGR